MSEIATPGLMLVTDLTVHVAPPIDVGETPHGGRRIIPLLGGTFSGPRLNGRMIPGGSDFQYWRNDGCTEIHARYVLETGEGALIYVENTGLRHGPAEAMERLARGLPVDPAQIYFRSWRGSKPRQKTLRGSTAEFFSAPVRVFPTVC